MCGFAATDICAQKSSPSGTALISTLAAPNRTPELSEHSEAQQLGAVGLLHSLRGAKCWWEAELVNEGTLWAG